MLRWRDLAGARGPLVEVAIPDRVSILADVAEIVSRSHDLRETLANVADLVAKRLDADVCSIYLTDADLRKQFDTNVFGLVDLTNRVAPLMKAQGSGDIVNIASTSGTKGAKGGTAYSGSKWAVRGISQCWQAELRPHGIRVVCILPSEVQTNWMGKTGRNNPNKLYAGDIAATIITGLNMQRRVLWPELAIFANNPWKED